MSKDNNDDDDKGKDDDGKQDVLGVDHKAAKLIVLRQKLDAKKRGDRITAAEIVEWTGFPNWRAFAVQIHRWARDNGFGLDPVVNDGWRIVLGHEVVDLNERKRKTALRIESRSLRLALATPTVEMDPRQELRHQRALERTAVRVATARQHNVATLKELRGESRPPLRVITDGKKKDDDDKEKK